MDSLAAAIDATLEEEELIADQLKEWLFASSALQAVVRRREALQLSKEEACDNLTALQDQKEKIVQGKQYVTLKFCCTHYYKKIFVSIMSHDSALVLILKFLFFHE